MPKGPNGEKRPADAIGLAVLIGRIATGEVEDVAPDDSKDPAAKALGAKADPAMISTSHVERQNLTMRMGMRRFTRLTNGFSKKLENRQHMLLLYFVHYNFVRIYKTLKCTPAMAAGVSATLPDMT
jgi:hypothetical protein